VARFHSARFLNGGNFGHIFTGPHLHASVPYLLPTDSVADPDHSDSDPDPSLPGRVCSSFC
jgi:hypothetical protein